MAPRRSAAAIDLRSDICAQPTPEMRAAMQEATPGWATYGEDDKVRALEARGASLLGHESCVLVPTCTMANLLALLVLASENGVVVVERDAHVVRDEVHGITEIARCRPRDLAGERGRLDPDQVARALAGAALLWIENTHTRGGGTILDVAATRRLLDLARENDARVFIDGARLANAAVALDVPLASLASGADAVSLSLNKGLSAPYGALLAGSRELIETARRRLRQLGGGTVHKAGIGAAAGLVALDTMFPQLRTDHLHARRLASLVGVDPDQVETNIVLVDVSDARSAVRALAADRVLAMAPDDCRIRLVTHRLVSDDDVEAAAVAVRALVVRS